MKLSICLVVCHKVCLWSYSKKSSGSTKEMLSLVKRPMFELFSHAGFSEGHLTGNLRSPSAWQPYRAISLAAPRVPCSQAECIQPLEQVDLGFFPYLWEKIQMHVVE